MTQAGYSHTDHSPLHRSWSIVENQYHIQSIRLEKRRPRIVRMRWTAPFTPIAGSPEVAIKEHDLMEPATVRMYTDGGAIDGHVGAAAVAPTLQLADAPMKRTEYTGTSTSSTVHAAELGF